MTSPKKVKTIKTNVRGRNCLLNEDGSPMTGADLIKVRDQMFKTNEPASIENFGLKNTKIKRLYQEEKDNDPMLNLSKSQLDHRRQLGLMIAVTNVSKEAEENLKDKYG